MGDLKISFLINLKLFNKYNSKKLNYKLKNTTNQIESIL